MALNVAMHATRLLTSITRPIVDKALGEMGRQAPDSVSSRADGALHYPVWEDVRVALSRHIVSR